MFINTEFTTSFGEDRNLIHIIGITKAIIDEDEGTSVEEEFEVGQIVGYNLRNIDGGNDFELYDDESQDLSDIWSDTHTKKGKFRKELGDMDIYNTLVIDRFHVNVAYQGKNIGTKILHDFIEMFAFGEASWSVVLLRACPYFFERLDEPRREPSKQEKEKLIGWYKKRGFSLLKGTTDIMYFKPAYREPWDKLKAAVLRS